MLGAMAWHQDTKRAAGCLGTECHDCGYFSLPGQPQRCLWYHWVQEALGTGRGWCDSGDIHLATAAHSHVTSVLPHLHEEEEILLYVKVLVMW